MLDHLENRLDEIANPYLRARYADFLWQRKHRHEHARAAIEAHLAILEAYGEPGNHREAAESARRALWLAFALNDAELVEVVVEAVTRVAEGWARPDSEAYSALPIIEKILDNEQFSDAVILGRWANVLERGAQRENDHYLRRDFLSQLVRLLRRLGRPDEAQRIRIQIAQDLECEAQERQGESFLIAAKLYQDALNAYVEAGLPDKIQEMKLEMRRNYKRAEETEFKTLSVEIPVDLASWDAQVAEWLKLESPDALRHLAVYLIPDWDAAARQTIELQETGSISQLMPFVTVDDGRPVSGTPGGAERELEHVRRNYRWYVGFSSSLLARAVASFRDRGILSADSLVNAIKDSPVFPEDKLEIIRRGFERYVDTDHISAIHVLVPHLEDCLRRFLGSFEVPTTSWREGKLREKPLTQILEAEEMEAVLRLVSPQLWRYLEHALVAETGLNLRNDVAHGLLRADELNGTNANIVVHLYLLLGLLRAKKTDQA
jgi:hypothetical protein